MDMNAMKASAAALDGEWMDNLEGFGDFRVKIRSFDCPKADKYQQDLYRVVLGRRATRRDKTVPPEIRDYVACKTLIDVCVLDWENWEEDGKPVAYSKEKLEAFLLKDAPSGIRVGNVMKMTPDGKAYNFEGKFLYNELLRAAIAVDLPDDDDAEGLDALAGAEAEKNASRAGSKRASASREA